ncbi:FecR domain-containing protein [Aquimarina sp. ERC-38]|uniref:FecR family protein n=1 Tax=Aquimarina sp. ERC-38 TaxID=2949996 RepID=UPI002246053A|nr:FecR domain-containing protein [Aquimarina sp. ERC-38]UZO80852.1 FecR domain-containing protein [Aquimarina sp. ERC-38]
MDQKDNFLGRWLDNKLTAEEKISFERSKEFLAYQDILKTLDNIKKPEFDVEAAYKKQLLYNKEAKKSIQQKKVIQLKTWLYSAAAVALLLIGLKVFIFTDVIEATQIAESKTISLPDTSTVTLNALSSITYNSKAFKKNRIIKLQGEAFFKVAKGSQFTVETDKGSVTVLGTQFDVNSYDDTFIIRCFEGKVKVVSGIDSTTLIAGKGVRLDDTNKLSTVAVNGSTPLWINGKSNFSKESLKNVIAELQRYYEIEIKTENIDLTRLYSGSFVHDDLENALLSVFDPMDIIYNFTNSKVVVLSNQ